MKTKRIMFAAPRGFVGRNGTFVATGVEISRLENQSHIAIEPVTSRGITGRCCIEVPTDDTLQLAEAIQEVCGDKATPEEIILARVLYASGSDNDIEIDDNAITSRGEDAGGIWVSAWVWLPDGNNGK
ncbi:MAG: hypothetical protein C0402_05365 [Thermodesulfovibrio sp.]|nr:hypothetical protein [Thermodesulfovibrio sp.]